jgi:hypothetical protein
VALQEAKEYSDNSEVVFYRRFWFWGFSLFLFAPLGALIGLTEDVYRYEDKKVFIFPKVPHYCPVKKK